MFTTSLHKPEGPAVIRASRSIAVVAMVSSCVAAHASATRIGRQVARFVVNHTLRD